MSFTDWIEETRTKLRRDPAHVAAKGAVQELWVGALSRGASTFLDDKGEPIWNREFDVCCVVDSCRWDLFAEVCSEGSYDYLPGEPGAIRSVGSMSPEWVSRTFGPPHKEKARRSAYITANTFSGTDADDWPVLPLDESDVGYLDEAWRTYWMDDIEGGISIVPPEILTDKAIDVWRRHAELDVDQVVIHYMQPHTPFRSMPDQFPTYRGEQSGDGLKDDHLQKDLWKRCRDGELAPPAVWRAYKDNLEWVLDSIERLVNNCEGTVAITSDHGNGFGEWGVWGHPPGNPLDELRRVPWVTVEATDSKTYKPEVLGQDKEKDAETDVSVRGQLDALGYR